MRYCFTFFSAEGGSRRDPGRNEVEGEMRSSGQKYVRARGRVSECTSEGSLSLGGGMGHLIHCTVDMP